MKRTGPVRRSKRSLPAQSTKRANEREGRREVVEATAQRAGHKCEAADLVLWVTCWGPLDCDEIIARSQWPGGHLELKNTQLLCRAHHDWKHSHPEQARKLGMTKRAHERDAPVLRIW